MADQKVLLQRLLTQPVDTDVTSPQPPVPLSSAQEAALAQLIAEFDQPGLTFPTSTQPSDNSSEPQEPLTEWERCFLFSRENLLRCLRADRWNVGQARKRLEGTVAWRREAKMCTQDFSNLEGLVDQEGPTGKLLILGFDKYRRPVCHMRPRFQNTANTTDRLSFSYFGLDRAIDLMPDYQEKMSFLIDTSGNPESPSMAMQREFLKILSHHYCERLGRSAFLNVNIFFQLMVKLITPFIDPVTVQKISMDNKAAFELVPAEHRFPDANGSCEFVWDAATYWPTLYAECNKRRSERLQRFRDQGGKIGWSEWMSSPVEASNVTSPTENLQDQPAPQPTNSTNSTVVGTPDASKAELEKLPNDVNEAQAPLTV